jgi:hypothetical protein
MAQPTLNSVSPSFGPPGTAITCAGSGFDTGARVGCPALVDTEFISAAEVTAAIPADLAGPAGGSLTISVYVMNEDGSISAVLPFAVRFGGDRQQAWTSFEAVLGEVPGFKVGGDILESTIQGWIRSIAQQVNAAMLRRGLSLNPADWQQPDADTAMPTPASVLELVNRYGAAARLAAVVGARFSADREWSLAKALREDFKREIDALEGGKYDKLFRPSAATVEAGPQAAAGDISLSSGDADQAFSKDQVF